VNAFIDAATDYLRNRRGNPSALLERWAATAAAIGVQAFSAPWDSAVEARLFELFEIVKASFGGSNFDAFLRRAIGAAEWIAAARRYLALEGETRKMALLAILSKLLPALHGLRLFGAETRVVNVIDGIVALKDLEVWLAVEGQQGQLADAIDPTADALVNGTASPANLAGAIAKFAERATSLRPCNIFMIPRLQNNPALLALTYGRTSLFRDNGQKVLAYLSKGGGSVFDFSVALSAMASLSCEASCLVFESLALSGLSAILGQYIDLVSDQLSRVSQFVMTSLKPTNPANFTSLRKLNVKMLNNLDDLINLIESPVAPAADGSAFGVAKLEFEINLAELTHRIGQLIWTVTNSYVPEMYDADRMPIYGAMEAAVRGMKASAEKVLPQSAGSCRNDFASAMGGLEGAIQQWIVQSLSIDFCEPFAAASLIATVGDSLDFVLKVHKTSQALVVNLSFAPDRVSASALPDLEIPALDDVAPPFATVLGDLSRADQAFRGVFDVFSRAFADANSQSLTLVDAFDRLVKSAKPLVSHGFALAAAAVDSRQRPVLQEALRCCVDSFVLLKGAVRARLLRLPEFDAGFAFAISRVQASYQPILTAADALSRSNAPVFHEALDNHARSVHAGIADISARYKTVVASVNTSSVQKDDSSIAAHTDVEGAKRALLPCVAFHAPPIIEAVAAIVARVTALAAPQSHGAAYLALSDLSDAVGILFVCTEGLIGKMPEPEVRVLAAARAVCQAAAAVVGAVNGQNDQAVGAGFNAIADHAERIIARAAGIYEYEQRGRKPKVRAVNRMMEKLRLESEVETVARQVNADQAKLSVFSHRF
jgi:hypothetical protein